MLSDSRRKIRAGARRASSNADRTSPLRRIVGVVGEYPHERELLECGHVHRPRVEGAFGGTYLGQARRRRCKGCAAGRADHLDRLDVHELLDYAIKHQPPTADGAHLTLTRADVRAATRDRLLAVLRLDVWREAREALS